MTPHAKPSVRATREGAVRAAPSDQPDPPHEPEQYVLRLYIAGMTPRAGRAIAHVRAICDEQLAGRYALEVLDVYQQPALARDEQIIAAPTLIKRLPLPLRRLIGDMSNRDRLLVGLDLMRA
jgi:circadian clock protein KaiB